MRTVSVAVVLSLLFLGGCSRGGAAATATTSTGSLVATTYCAGTELGCVEMAYAGTGPKVLILGDSITDQSRDQLHVQLDGHAVLVSGAVGSTVADNIPVATVFAKSHPSVVVIDLGTNDAWDHVPTDNTVDEINTMLGLFPQSCAVMVTVTENGRTEPDPHGQTYSPELARAINGNLRSRGMRLVDWAGMVAENPEYVVDDGIHPSDAGKQALAEQVAVQVRSCEGGDR